MTDRPIPARKAVKTALRELGLSNRQVDALLRNGWKGLVGETIAENEDLREALGALQQRLVGVK